VAYYYSAINLNLPVSFFIFALILAAVVIEQNTFHFNSQILWEIRRAMVALETNSTLFISTLSITHIFETRFKNDTRA